MSLDRFTNPNKKIPKKTTKKKTSKKVKTKESTNKKKKASSKPVKPEIERKKFYLSCTTRCGYKRTLKKKELNEEDYICRKCRKKMKIVKS